mmetsp:Transcript_42385/g.80988  ORF Transcript_42385/g.80988 Transcript_42385/m.80988 type:complete len:103 (+) Transcript_42385:670-978(+)
MQTQETQRVTLIDPMCPQTAQLAACVQCHRCNIKGGRERTHRLSTRCHPEIFKLKDVISSSVSSNSNNISKNTRSSNIMNSSKKTRGSNIKCHRIPLQRLSQ